QTAAGSVSATSSGSALSVASGLRLDVSCCNNPEARARAIRFSRFRMPFVQKSWRRVDNLGDGRGLPTGGGHWLQREDCTLLAWYRCLYARSRPQPLPRALNWEEKPMLRTAFMTMLALLSSIEVAFTRRGIGMRRSFAGITALACLVAPASVLAENAYITNLVSPNVSVIDTATNTVIATIPVGIGQNGVAVTPDGSKVYVANVNVPFVSVIDTATNTVIATIPVGGLSPFGVAGTPDGSQVYVTDSSRVDHVSVIATPTNTVIATIPVGIGPRGVAVTPDGDRHAGKDEKEAQHGEAERDRHRRAGEHEGRKVYVANRDNDNVSVIDTATNTVIATIPVGS